MVEAAERFARRNKEEERNMTRERLGEMVALYREEVWPARVFYLGLEEAVFADVTNGRVRDLFRAQCAYDAHGGTMGGGVAPARVGKQKGIYYSCGDSAFNAAAFPDLMTSLMMQRQRLLKSGVACLVEPACGFGQARPAIAQKTRTVIEGNPYWGTVEMSRVLCLGLFGAPLRADPFVLACCEGPESWSGVVVEGSVVKGTYRGFNPRVRKSDGQQLMRKRIALKLMQMEAEQAQADNPDEQRVLMHVREQALAKSVVESCSVYCAMTQERDLGLLLRKGIVLVLSGGHAFDEAAFLKHCILLSLEPQTCVRRDERALSALVVAGACVLATNFAWAPTAL